MRGLVLLLLVGCLYRVQCARQPAPRAEPNQLDLDPAVVEEWERNQAREAQAMEDEALPGDEDYMNYDDDEDVTFSEVLHFPIDGYGEETFYEQIDEVPVKIRGAFLVVRSETEVELTVRGPFGDELASVKGQNEGFFNFEAKPQGVHTFVISNSRSSSPQEVMFGVHKPTNDPPSLDSIMSTNSTEEEKKMSQLARRVTNIASLLDAVEGEQKYLMLRERTNRDTNESTGSRVLWFTVVETLVYLVACYGQVHYIQKLVDNRALV